MRKALILLAFMAFWIALTCVALLWGTTFNFPDNVHTDYGFPLKWATHTTSNFIGAADQWTVETNALLGDLLFWLALMEAAVAVYLYRFRRVSD